MSNWTDLHTCWPYLPHGDVECFVAVTDPDSRLRFERVYVVIGDSGNYRFSITNDDYFEELMPRRSRRLHGTRQVSPTTGIDMSQL